MGNYYSHIYETTNNTKKERTEIVQRGNWQASNKKQKLLFPQSVYDNNIQQIKMWLKSSLIKAKTSYAACITHALHKPDYTKTKQRPYLKPLFCFQGHHQCHGDHPVLKPRPSNLKINRHAQWYISARTEVSKWPSAKLSHPMVWPAIWTELFCPMVQSVSRTELFRPMVQNVSP